MQLVGLQRRPELNGREGVVRAYRAAEARCEVALDGGDELKVKLTNVEVVEAQEGALPVAEPMGGAEGAAPEINAEATEATEAKQPEAAAEDAERRAAKKQRERAKKEAQRLRKDARARAAAPQAVLSYHSVSQRITASHSVS